MSRVSDGVEVPDDVPLKIETVTAYVVLDPTDNNEGIPAMQDPYTREWLPMIGADHEMLESLRPHAEKIARKNGWKVSLVRFSTREVLVDDILNENVTDERDVANAESNRILAERQREEQGDFDDSFARRIEE